MNTEIRKFFEEKSPVKDELVGFDETGKNSYDICKSTFDKKKKFGFRSKSFEKSRLFSCKFSLFFPFGIDLVFLYKYFF